MPQRAELQTLLESILGTSNVYFQPPVNIQLVYPCIVYERSRIETDFANNYPYRHKKRYQLTVIDHDPDSPIVDQIASLPLCSNESFFTAKNLNHAVFNLYF